MTQLDTDTDNMPKACDAPQGAITTIQAAKPRCVVKAPHHATCLEQAKHLGEMRPTQ